MKASRFFDGNDTYGRSIELAQSESGTWFYRYYDYNGYGMGWSAWDEHEAPQFETHGTNKYSGERFEYEKPVAFWGFNKLSEYTEIPRVRLPY